MRGVARKMPKTDEEFATWIAERELGEANKMAAAAKRRLGRCDRDDLPHLRAMIVMTATCRSWGWWRDVWRRTFADDPAMTEALEAGFLEADKKQED